ncbi:MAG: endonuclease MutS2 [Cellulosilyticaceae bacterium]
MNEKTLLKLEFHKIRDMLKQHAITAIGKEQVSKLMPSADFEQVCKWQKETSEALAMSVKKGRLPVGSIQDIRAALKRVEVGAVLSSQEILNINNVLRSARVLKRYYKEDEEETSYPVLAYYFESLETNPTLEHEISRCIVGPDEYADDATPELAQVRKQIKSSHQKIRETIQNVLHGSHYQDMIQEPIVTMRQDRYCIPIKVEYKNTFKGIVHDQSSTGATVFIEPAAVVELGNQLRILFSKEQDEIEKILANLTNAIEPLTPYLIETFKRITELDVIFAKAEFSLKLDAREPRLNHKGIVSLRKARHPMLPKEYVVPIDVRVGDDFTTLLITGPNTGGKTVTLKTVGLFTLMAQTGMQIPAAEGSEVAVFDEVFADLGDEQSIEQSLSTFSSHMTHIVSILEKMTLNSLILLDEVGSGTDPVEGAALAKAILEHLRKQQIRAVATTHYSELKLYALSTENVENASCEFDVESLRPTYKLMIGIPGKSNAFAISKRLGLPDHLIDDARVFLQQEDVKMEDILVELEYSRKIADIEKEKAQSFRKEAERLQSEIKEQRQKLEKSKQKVLERANYKAQELLKKVEIETDQILKEVRQAARQAQVTIDERSLQQAKQNASDVLKNQHKVVGKVVGPKHGYKKVPKNIEVGEAVMVTSLMQQGIVVEAPDQQGNLMVRVGILPIKVHLSGLQRAEEKEQPILTQKKARPTPKVSHHISKTSNIRTETDVRGLMVDEALPIVDKYLDDAYLAGLKHVTIIHGKGTGALRQAITQMLKRHPHVQSHRPGKYGEGEMGVTVVEIK